MMKPKSGYQDAPDVEDAQPGSTVRAKRRRLDPRLEAIAEQARQGQLTEQEALDQMVQVLSEWAGRAMPADAQRGVATALREFARDPKVLAMLREEDE